MLEGALAPACEEALARREVPGAAIGVLAGERVWTAGFGMLDVRSREPVAADSSFRIASVTKPFTATLALQASLSGAIGFDEEVPGPVEGVTVQHLLSHLVASRGNAAISLASATATTRSRGSSQTSEGSGWSSRRAGCGRTATPATGCSRRAALRAHR